MSRFSRNPEREDMSPGARPGKRDNDLLRFHGEAATSAVEEAAANYQAPSIIAAGADAQSVSLLTTVINFLLSAACVKTPRLIERIGLGKKGAILLAGINLCTWVPLALLVLLPQPMLAPLWFAVMWLINVMPGILLSVQRDNWMSSVIPKGMMGRYLGQRMAIRSAFYLIAFCLSGYLLDSVTGGTLNGFAAIFIMAFLAVMTYFTIYCFMNDPRNNRKNNPGQKQEEFGLFGFIGELKERKLGAFILFVSLFGLSVSICGPLYAVYMLQELNFSYLNFTIIVSVQYFARVASGPFWGRYTDKVGNIRVMNLVTRIMPLVPICWIFCPSIAYIAVIQAVSGLCWGAYDLCIQNYLFKLAPPSKKLRYIVYSKALSLFCMAAGGLLSFYLLKGIVPIAGSKILSIFLVSGIFRALVVVTVVPRLIDMAMSFGLPNIRLKLDLGAVNSILASKSGIYYQSSAQEAPVEAPHQSLKERPGINEARPVDEVTVPHEGYYQTHQKTYTHYKAGPAKGTPSWQKGNPDVQPAMSYDGLYYRNLEKVNPAKALASWQKESSDVHPAISYDSMHCRAGKQAEPANTNPPAPAINRVTARISSQRGLYYSPEGWARYRSNSLESIIRDIGIPDSPPPLPKCFHIPASPYTRRFTGG